MILRHLRQLGVETVVYGLSGVISRFLNIILVPIYTRLFSPEDYGIISLIATTTALISAFVVLGLDSAAGRWYWDTEDTSDRKSTMVSWAWCQIFCATLLGYILFISAGWLGQVIVGHKDAELYFQLAAFTIPLGTLSGVTTNWLRFQRRPWATTIFSFSTSLISILLTITFVIGLRWGLKGVYIAQIWAAVVSTLLSVILMWDWLNPSHFQWQRLNEMLKFAFPLIPAAVAAWIVNLSDRYFVQYYNSTSEVGYYQVANAIAIVVALGMTAFQQAWGPFAMSIHKQGNAKAVYAKVLLIYTWLTCLVSTALSLFAPEIIHLVATEQYLKAHSAVPWLAFSYIFVGLGYVAAIGLNIAKTTRSIGLAIILSAIFNIVLNLLLVPHWGMEGAAISTLLSQAIVPLYLFYRAQQLYFIPYQFGPTLSIISFSLLLVLLTSRWQLTNLWLSLSIKFGLLTLFIPAVFFFRIITISQAKRLFLGYFSSEGTA